MTYKDSDISGKYIATVCSYCTVKRYYSGAYRGLTVYEYSTPDHTEKLFDDGCGLRFVRRVTLPKNYCIDDQS